MYSARIDNRRWLPKLILDKRFSKFRSLDVGAKGQCVAQCAVNAERLVPDDEGNDVKYVELNIISAEITMQSDKRI